MSGDARKELAQFATQLAMHVAATQPTYLSAQDIPPATAEAERASFQAQVQLAGASGVSMRSGPGTDAAVACVSQAAASGKPAKVADKMVDGWMHKWCAAAAASVLTVGDAA